MQVLEATKIARNIIRAAVGDTDMWTNNYKNCRTVKCYIFNKDCIAQIEKQVAEQLPEATVKVIGSLDSWISPSLIVRIPN